MVIAKWRIDDYFKADAQKVAEEIMELGDGAKPHEIVERARDESSELHKCFEWDDTIAAEKYRIVQARKVVHMIVIKEEKKPVDRPEIRFFYKAEKEEGYKPTKVIVKKENSYKELLENAYRELRAFKIKYACLQELQEIFDLID